MPEMPLLSILLLDRLLIHEQHDEQRARPLVLRLRSSGVIRNPAIVTPLNDGSDRYMVLDGANRVTALRQLGCPHILAQIVEPDDPGLTLHTWNHVVWELNPFRFINSFRRSREIQLVFEYDRQAQPDLISGCRLALIQDCRGRLFSVCSDADTLQQRVAILNHVVGNYHAMARLDRTSVREVSMLEDIYPALAGLVIFPTFKINDLLKLAGQGSLLPAGITRFSIAPRALHLNYPLDELFASKTIEQKNHALQKWLQERISLMRVRYYAEPTFLFDE